MLVLISTLYHFTLRQIERLKVVGFATSPFPLSPGRTYSGSCLLLPDSSTFYGARIIYFQNKTHCRRRALLYWIASTSRANTPSILIPSLMSQLLTSHYCSIFIFLAPTAALTCFNDFAAVRPKDPCWAELLPVTAAYWHFFALSSGVVRHCIRTYMICT
jgi:hypothetical protein